MPWKLYDTFTDGIDGQAVFSDAALKSADKKKQLEDIVGTLKDLNRAIIAVGGAVVFPRAKGGQNIAKAFVADAQKFIAGAQMKQLHGALKITSTRIDRALADAAKDQRKIEKKLIPLLKTISAECTNYGKSIDRKVLIPRVGKLAHAMIEADKVDAMKKIGPVSKAAKSCAAKGHTEINSSARLMRNWDESQPEQNAEIAKKVGNMLRDACRDMSQNMVNMKKMLDYGLDIPGFGDREAQTVPKLAKFLTPYANSQSGSVFTNGKSRAEMLQLIKTMKVQADLFDNVVAALP